MYRVREYLSSHPFPSSKGSWHGIQTRSIRSDGTNYTSLRRRRRWTRTPTTRPGTSRTDRHRCQESENTCASNTSGYLASNSRTGPKENFETLYVPLSSLGTDSTVFLSFICIIGRYPLSYSFSPHRYVLTLSYVDNFSWP